MIAVLAPFAFVLLASLPVLWWLHRREPRPPVVDVPSLLFLEAETTEAVGGRRRRSDAELVLSLAAATCLSIAAAGPLLAATGDGRRVLVVIDASPAMEGRGADGTTAAMRAHAAADAIRRTTSGDDRFETSAASGDELVRRVRDASAAVRVLVSDRRPRDLPVGVVFVGVGERDAVNAGIVSLDVDVVEGRRRAAATIWNDAAVARRLRAGPVGGEIAVDLPAFGARRVSWTLDPVPAAGALHPIVIHVVDDGGSLAADDEVIVDPTPFHVGFATGPSGPSSAVETATRRALDAVFVGAWRDDGAVEGGLFVGPAAAAPPQASIVLEIARVPPGVEPIRPGERDARVDVDAPLARDLDLADAEWLYPPGPASHAPWPRITIEPADSASRRIVRWHADPSLGRPSALESPLWPLFIENVARLGGGAPGIAGHRWSGLLDVEVTRVGRDVVPFDASVLASAPRDRAARHRPIGPWFGVAGALCLGALWLRARALWFRERNAPASPVR